MNCSSRELVLAMIRRRMILPEDSSIGVPLIEFEKLGMSDVVLDWPDYPQHFGVSFL